MNNNSNSEFDLIISGGTAITTLANGSVKEVKTDIGIKSGKIVELGDLSQKASLKKISAVGLHVIPGVIDTQVHFREPGMTHKEDFESGTRGALLGGVTSVFEMPNTIPATTTLSAINDKVQSAKSKAWVNMAFYVGASSENINELNQLEYAPGCCGVKIFMGSSTGSLLVEDDESLLKVLKNGKRRVAVHCEDEYRMRERKYIALEGKHASFHPQWRDEESALKATTRIVKLAKEAKRPVHILHVNSADEIEFLAAHKNVASVEVLPQHLTLFAPDCYDRLGNYAQQNPPIRTKEHMEALWNALQKGVVDIIGSDHAPHTHEEKSREYPQSPSGMPGVQTLLPIMLNHVHNGKLSLEHLVRLVAHNPVKLFGIKNKGHIRQGFDADLTLVDLKSRRRIENSWIASRSGWTPFDGMQVNGWPKGTIIHGELKMFEDQIIGPHTGEILEFEF